MEIPLDVWASSGLIFENLTSCSLTSRLSLDHSDIDILALRLMGIYGYDFRSTLLIPEEFDSSENSLRI